MRDDASPKAEAGCHVEPSAPPLAELDPEPEPQPKPGPRPEPKPEPEPVAEAVANNIKSPERPSTLRVEPVAETGIPIPAVSPAGSTISRRGSQLTEQGFFDVKFYHNKLW